MSRRSILSPRVLLLHLIQSQGAAAYGVRFRGGSLHNDVLPLRSPCLLMVANHSIITCTDGPIDVPTHSIQMNGPMTQEL
jgi:hypothetical protein